MALVAGMSWAAVLAAHVAPLACVSIMEVLAAHSPWLLTVIVFCSALLAPPLAEVPSLHRPSRVINQWVSDAEALVLALAGLLLGGWLHSLDPGASAALAMGVFAVAPFIWMRVANAPPPASGVSRGGTPHTQNRLRTPVIGAALRIALLAALALGRPLEGADPLPPLLAFASAATISALAVIVTRGELFFTNIAKTPHWIPAATILVWVVAGGGLQRLGYVGLGAAFMLVGWLWRVPPAIQLALWIPWLL
jgi:hypothetical protein